MADKFAEALEDLRDALLDGEVPEQAVCGVAASHGISEIALTNRATKAFGDLATLKARKDAQVAANADRSVARRDELAERAAREAATVAEFFRTYDFRTNTFRA